jgi:hypothetical protein
MRSVDRDLCIVEREEDTEVKLRTRAAFIHSKLNVLVHFIPHYTNGAVSKDAQPYAKLCE